MSELEASLEAMKRDKVELLQKNAALEHALRLRQQQARFDAQPAEFDGLYYVSLDSCNGSAGALWGEIWKGRVLRCGSVWNMVRWHKGGWRWRGTPATCFPVFPA